MATKRLTFSSHSFLAILILYSRSGVAAPTVMVRITIDWMGGVKWTCWWNRHNKLFNWDSHGGETCEVQRWQIGWDRAAKSDNLCMYSSSEWLGWQVVKDSSQWTIGQRIKQWDRAVNMCLVKSAHLALVLTFDLWATKSSFWLEHQSKAEEVAHDVD